MRKLFLGKKWLIVSGKKYNFYEGDRKMGFLGNIIKNAVGEGISNAVGKAVESAVAPAAEKLANAAAGHLNTSAEVIEKTDEAMASQGSSLAGAFANLEKASLNYANAATGAMWNSLLAPYPKWELCPIKDINTEETDEGVSLYMSVDATLEMLDEYHRILEANGFAGDYQIKKKLVDGHEYNVDYSFADPGSDCQIHYYIRK